MDKLIQLIHELPNQNIDYTFLKSFVEEVQSSPLEYLDLLPKPENPFEYGRNILTLKPFECVLLNWPPGVESAIHLHSGVFGFVLVLRGEINNHFYTEKPGELIEHAIQTYIEGGLLPEPDGVIHKIANRSKLNNAVTLHFYHPAIESLEDLKIYQETTGSIGILSKQATSACWSDNPNHFKSIQENAFVFKSYEEVNQEKTHIIHPVYPKPEAHKIKEMNKAYYNEQAYIYDNLDQQSPTRKAYTAGIDKLIATDLNNSPTPINKVIDIATGTGRRPLHIKELSGLDYTIIGIESSEEMALKAKEKGLEILLADWTNFNLLNTHPFDVVTLLYGFGHIPNITNRLKLLRNINKHLKLGGSFYFDTFNINNENEWGPTCQKQFNQFNQAENGYQLGDVFYKRTQGNQIAFLHYFTKQELEELLISTGFKMEYCKIIGYNESSGIELEKEDKGLYFIKAVKVAEV